MFKVGQRVRCISDNGYPEYRTIGKIYTVSDIGGGHFLVKENNYLHATIRFEPASQIRKRKTNNKGIK